MATRYYIRLPDGSRARGTTPSLSFTAQGVLQLLGEAACALREPALFERWRLLQDEPDEVDPALGVTDPNAVVHGEQHDLHIDLQVTSSIPGHVLKQRLRLLAGSAWELRDVTAA